MNGVSIQKRKTYLVLFAAFFIVVFAIRVLLAASVFKTSPTAATATEQTQNGVFDEAASSEKDKIKVLEYDMNPSADKADLDQLKIWLTKTKIMQKKNNNKFRLLCVGVVAFSAVAIILFVALGGGQGVENVATQEGFNANLPTADMESVTEDRILAARLEDQRRKKEEMQGISGSTFRLLEIEEKEKTETVTDSAFSYDIVLSEAKSLIDEKLDETRINEEISNTLQQDAGGYSPSDGLAKVNAINEELKNKRKEKYKQMQQIYGTDLLPDMQEEQEQQQKKQAMTTPVETATPAPKKEGFQHAQLRRLLRTA